MIKVFYTHIDKEYSPTHFDKLLNNLPNELTKKILRYKRWEDRHNGLIGKLLLKHGMQIFDLPGSSLYNLKYSDYGKPFLTNGLNFNISHSGSLVVCALSVDANLGIDVERIKTIKINDFIKQWSKEEWNSISLADDTHLEFFRFWTRKEAIIKANGKGLSLPLGDFDVVANTVTVEGQTWYLKQICMYEGYTAHLALDCDVNSDVITVDEVDFSEDG